MAGREGNTWMNSKGWRLSFWVELKLAHAHDRQMAVLVQTSGKLSLVEYLASGVSFVSVMNAIDRVTRQ